MQKVALTVEYAKSVLDVTLMGIHCSPILALTS